MLISLLGLIIFYLLDIKIGISLMQYKRHAEFRKEAYFDNLLPTNLNYSLASFEDMGLRSCGVACLETLPICAGFLYNRRSKSCKLMRLYLDKRFLTVPFDGWKFYYDTKACDPGWTPYNGHCYLLGNSLLTWTTSQVQCQAYGGYVLEVESVEENMWITEIFLPIPDNECSEWRFCNVWIGATDSDIEGTFTWIRNKEELTYLPWDVGQPDDKNGQDCIRLNSSGRWKDASCKDNNRMNYICEKNSS